MGLVDGTSDNMADKNPFKKARRKDMPRSGILNFS